MAALLLATVSAAGAAGLGKLAVLSALGEPLRAEIDVLSSRDETAALTPRLVSPDAYARLDFQYNPALTSASLALRQHPNGRNFIEVVSSRPVNEPFIHLLVELELNGARIVRGYTAFIDPRGYGPPGEAAAEFSPAVILAVVPAVPPASAAPRASRAPVNVDAKAVAGGSGEVGQEIRRLEERLNASAKTLASMLDRVAAVELEIRKLQGTLASQSAVAAAPKTAAAAPTVAATTPTAAPAVPESAKLAAAAPPAPPQPVAQAVREQPAVKDAPAPPRARKPNYLINEALLVLAGGALIMFVGLGYWVWGRRASSKESSPKSGGG